MADPLLLTLIPTGTDVDAFLEGLHIAIRLEEEGILFYTLNANRMRNPRGRAAFHLLLRDERAHAGRLKTQLDALKQALAGTPDEPRGGVVPVRTLTLNPIFSRGRTLIDRDADEREVFRLAIAVEWDAFNFFRERSESATDPWSRVIFGDLALEEKQHYDTMVDAYETIIGRKRYSI